MARKAKTRAAPKKAAPKKKAAARKTARAGLVGRPRAKPIRYRRPGIPKCGQWFGPLV